MDAKRLAQLAGIKPTERTPLSESIVVAELDVNSKATEHVAGDDTQCKIPANVKSELKSAVSTHLDAGNEMKAAGREQEARYHFITAEFLSELQTIMAGGTEDDIKRASVKVHSAKDSHMRQIPKVVYDFLVPNAFEMYSSKSLSERFEEAQKNRTGV